MPRRRGGGGGVWGWMIGGFGGVHRQGARAGMEEEREVWEKSNAHIRNSGFKSILVTLQPRTASADLPDKLVLEVTWASCGHSHLSSKQPLTLR